MWTRNNKYFVFINLLFLKGLDNVFKKCILQYSLRELLRTQFLQFLFPPPSIYKKKVVYYSAVSILFIGLHNNLHVFIDNILMRKMREKEI